VCGVCECVCVCVVCGVCGCVCVCVCDVLRTVLGVSYAEIFIAKLNSQSVV